MKISAKKAVEFVFFGILFLAFGLLYWLLYTNSGLNWSLKQINQASHSLLDYDTASGAWLTAIEFDHLTVQTPPMLIRGNKPRVKLSFKHIFSGTIEIVAFHATDLALTQKPAPAQETKEQKAFSLPVSITIKSLQIDRFSYQQHDQSPMILQQIEGRDTSIHRQISIGHLSAQSQFGKVSVDGTLVPQANGEVKLHSAFSIKSGQETPEISGTALLSGTINNLSVHTQISRPYDVLIDATLDTTEKTPTWRVAASATEVSFQSLFSIPLDLAKVKLEGHGNFDEYSIEATAALKHENYGEWDTKLIADKTRNQWNIHTLNLVNEVTGTSAHIEGLVTTAYAFDTSTPFALQATWQNLQWPLQSDAVINTRSGKLSLDGNLRDYQLDAAGLFGWSDKEISNIQIKGNGKLSNFVFNDISGDYEQGHISGSGVLDVGKAVTWHAIANLSSLNLVGFYSKLETKLAAKVDIDGRYDEQKLNMSYLVRDLNGTLHKRPIQGKGKVTYDDNKLSITGINLRSGKNHLQGQLAYTGGNSVKTAIVEAQWKAQLGDLQQLSPELKGKITSEGALSGAMETLAGKASLDASNLQFSQYKINKADLNAKIDLSSNNKNHISLAIQQALVDNIPVEGAKIVLSGTELRHTIEADISQQGDNHMTLRALGSLEESRWNLDIIETDINTKQFGKWRQSQSAGATLTTNSLTLDLYCLSTNRQGKLCVSANSQQYATWDGKLAVERIPLATFREFLPPQFDSTDVDLSGHGNFHYASDTGVLLDFKANGKNGVISGIEVQNKPTPVAFSEINFELSNFDKKLEANTSITIEGTGNIELAVSFPHWSKLAIPDLNENIQGHVVVDLTNLTVLSVISDHIKDPVGHWHGDITISGTLQSPIIIGESEVKASSLTLSTLGLKLNDVDIKATSSENRAINITGSAKSGDGSIKISGFFNDYRATENTGSIKITGANFLLARIPEATIIVSPDLKLTLGQNAVDLSGDILITEANFKIFAPTKTIAPSPDVVIVSPVPEEPKAAPLNLSSKVRIILGKKVNVQGYGFTGRLDGSVLVDDTKALTTASGEIKILQGKYVAYGQTLDISQGELTFSGGAIDNPLINVRAERHPGENVVVGVLIEGEVKSPKISLFSEPAMEDGDILSYIVLGYPLSEASNEDGKTLTKAAASLGLIGGEKLAKQIGKRFGIDEIKIQTDHTTQDTSLLLGKYLSPDFYVGYAIGIGNAVDTLQMQYKLTEQWVLKTQSGEGQKAELLFTIEKD